MSNVIMFSSIVSVTPVSQSSLTPRAGSEQPADPRLAAAAVRAIVSRRRSTKPATALCVLALTAVGAALLRRRYLRWGATTDERDMSLAGDELLPAVDQSATRAITIDAAAEDIWPWLVQLGQGRGGFYSYTWLENLVPKENIHNADRIVAQWQQIAVGGEVRLHPEVRLRVAVATPGQALVLFGGVPMGETAAPYEFSWAFVLVPQPDGTTRLIVRERYQYTHRWAAFVVQPAQLVSSLMSPKMLRGIKMRAERAISDGREPATGADPGEMSPTTDGQQSSADVPAGALLS